MLQVSVDLNYRKKLWSEAEAQKTMRPLMRHVDVVIANEEDMQIGARAAGAGYRRHRRPIERGGLPAGGRAAVERVRSDDRGDHAAREPLGERQRLERGAVGRARRARSTRASATRSDSSIASAAATASPAGLIYGLITGRTPEASLRFAVAASALKQTIPWRLQSRHGGRSRSPCRRRCVRARTAVENSSKGSKGQQRPG